MHVLLIEAILVSIYTSRWGEERILPSVQDQKWIIEPNKKYGSLRSVSRNDKVSMLLCHSNVDRGECKDDKRSRRQCRAGRMEVAVPSIPSSTINFFSFHPFKELNYERLSWGDQTGRMFIGGICACGGTD